MDGVRASGQARPPTKELFLIIPTHMMNSSNVIFFFLIASYNFLLTLCCNCVSNNSYACHEQGINPGQVRAFNGVLYKL